MTKHLSDYDAELRDLPNLDDELVTRLQSIGIKTPAQLRETGVSKTVNLLRHTFNDLSDNLAACLEGAILGIHWKNVERSEKEPVRGFYRHDDA